MAKNKATKVTLEEEVNTLKKHFGGIIATVKALKEIVDNLQKNLGPKEKDGIQEIIDKQKALDKAIAANDAALDKIKKEMLDLKESNTKANIEVKDDDKREKICRYFNRGYCKYKSRCRFTHSEELCQEYIKTEKCSRTSCTDRHPKKCKWFEAGGYCKRDSQCEYLHVTPVFEDEGSYKCESCTDIWNDKRCVVQQNFNGKQFYLCLNCDEWIQCKANIFDAGWTLLDKQGNLRTDV